MENRNELDLTCFTTEFIDIKILSSVLAMKPFLSNYTDAFSHASLQYKQVKSEEYMGFTIPLAKMEYALQQLQNNIVVIGKYPLNVSFFRLEEAIMHTYPKLSFLLRNSTIEYQGNDILLNSNYGTILFVALYNTPNHVVTIPVQ
tara:strand:+ start:1256 stop:1690 length:435 start_codon:yes stop_codon:yes gene_type:complete